jgi:predicted DNA-binding antitoxin AbrB/MazE fold protein
MNIQANAVYRNGVLQPAKPLPLAENEQVTLTITAPHVESADVSLEEFDRLVEENAFDVDTPSLPADFSSKDIYADHD